MDGTRVRGHSCARSDSGEVWCWGGNDYSQLGDGSTADSATPVAVIGLPAVEQISIGVQFGCARTEAGEVWCWGSNSSGQLGGLQSNTGWFPPAPIKGVHGLF